MTTYTFVPLGDPNATNFGFWIMLLIASIIAAKLVSEYPKRDEIISIGIFWLIAVSTTAYFSFKQVAAPLNEPVEATLIGGCTVPKELQHTRSTANNYVTYKTPTGEVSFLQYPNFEYPTTAILYKQNGN